MRRITTPMLCLFLGLLMVFAMLVDVSGAAADDDDDDDRRGYRYSEWRHHGHHHGKHRHHRSGVWYHGDEYENCDHEGESYRHAGGHRHRHHGHRRFEHSSDWSNIEQEELEEFDTGAEAVWRNPDSPLPTTPSARTRAPRIASGSPDASAAGPCREFYREARIGGRVQQVYGLACRQPDGSWKFTP